VTVLTNIMSGLKRRKCGGELKVRKRTPTKPNSYLAGRGKRSSIQTQESFFGRLVEAEKKKEGKQSSKKKNNVRKDSKTRGKGKKPIERRKSEEMGE